ncbi:MAG: hypothetical protein P1V51_03895 [Deltaproteobacteria bacterium]|nr:hypothetical protein [Deltaproteobacteria bacterium]
MSSSSRWSVACLALLSLLCEGCGAPEPLAIPAGCQPLATELDCFLPFPSDHFREADAAMPTGFRVAFPDAALVHTPEAEAIDPTLLHPADGWSLHPSIYALLPGAIDDGNLIFHDDPAVATTLDAAGPTVLLDGEGRALLHFAELDPRPADPARRAIFLRPMRPLAPATRHVVALRGLRGLDGELLPAPEAFRRIRDGETRHDPVLDPLAERYEEEVFPLLEAAGVARDELQLAWDFTTRSAEQTTADLLEVRRAILEAFGAAPPVVRIIEVLDDVDAQIFRKVSGTLEVPLFVEDENTGAMLRRGADGLPEASGVGEVPFTAVIPRSVGEAPAPARIIQFGHGFFGGQDEITDGFSVGFAQDTASVFVAANWQGMARADMVSLGGDLITDPSIAMRFVDRLHQGMANQLALAFALKEVLPLNAAFQVGGVSLLDPERLYFYGLSNGHILGGTFLALSPFHDRAALSVGGASYNFIMFRSRNFESLLGVIAGAVPDALDQQKVTSLMQLTLDRIDPITYASHVVTSPLPGGLTGRRVLLQIGLGDTAVPNLASHLDARALGIPLMQPGPRSVVGLDEVTAPHAGSALVEFDFGVPAPLPGTHATIPPEGTSVHGDVRNSPEGQAQVDAFLSPGGEILQTCDGPCDPD